MILTRSVQTFKSLFLPYKIFSYVPNFLCESFSFRLSANLEHAIIQDVVAISQNHDLPPFTSFFFCTIVVPMVSLQVQISFGTCLNKVCIAKNRDSYFGHFFCDLHFFCRLFYSFCKFNTLDTTKDHNKGNGRYMTNNFLTFSNILIPAN